MSVAENKLHEFVAAAIARPVAPEVAALGEHVRSLHGDVKAVLAYGSCLRGESAIESLADFYVLTVDLAGVSSNIISRVACALSPPNVYYAEIEFGGHAARAKYAAMPLSSFAAWMKADNPYFWARFSQPSVLLFAADDADRRDVIGAIAAAIGTMLANAKGILPGADPLEQWRAGLAATYATELRAESAARAAGIVTANADYCREAALLLDGIPAVYANWRRRRVTGKLWSIARLAKAAFTFSGGADYIAWKIERHSGHRIELSRWQRRHPILAGLLLLPQLLRQGAVR